MDTLHSNQTNSSSFADTAVKLPVLLTVISALLILSGIMSNLFTCFVIIRTRYMHTATNYYLFNLAVADILIVTFSGPNEIYGYWYPYHWTLGRSVCCLKTWITEMVSYASNLTIVAFTVERYLAICHPVRTHTERPLGRNIWVMTCIWAMASLGGVPLATQFDVVDIGGGMKVCTVDRSQLFWTRRFFEALFVVLFVMPMIVIVTMYAKIGLAIRNSMMLRFVPAPPTTAISCPLNSYRSADTNTNTDVQNASRAELKVSVIKMLGLCSVSLVFSLYAVCVQCSADSSAAFKRVLFEFVLVGVCLGFFICWAPFHVERLLAAHEVTISNDETHQMVYFFCGCLYLGNSTLNPILYNVLSLRFRLAGRSVLKRCCQPPARKSHMFPMASTERWPNLRSAPARGAFHFAGIPHIVRVKTTSSQQPMEGSYAMGNGEPTAPGLLAPNGASHRHSAESRSSGRGKDSLLKGSEKVPIMVVRFNQSKSRQHQQQALRYLPARLQGDASEQAASPGCGLPDSPQFEYLFSPSIGSCSLSPTQSVHCRSLLLPCPLAPHAPCQSNLSASSWNSPVGSSKCNHAILLAARSTSE